MTFSDWAKESRERIERDGLDGVKPTLVELWYGIRDRFRRIHWLTSNSRTLMMGNTEVEVQQRHIGEFDQIRGHHNESWLAEDLTSELGPGDCFWDVGSNIGLYTLLAASRGADVVAFEPSIENAATIERNLRQNELSARVIPKALSDEEGPRDFTLDERETPGAGRGSLLDDWQDGETRTVECVRGDSEVESGDLPRPSVVKIDVEGAELSVLKGLGDLLEDIRLVYCELHGINDHEVRRLLETRGFVIDADLDDTGCGVIRARG